MTNAVEEEEREQNKLRACLMLSISEHAWDKHRIKLTPRQLEYFVEKAVEAMRKREITERNDRRSSSTIRSTLS